MQQLIKEKDLPVDDKWRPIGQGYVKANRKDYINKEIIEQQKTAKKNAMNMAMTRTQKRDVRKRHQELNREVKGDNMMYLEQ